jgi:thiazole tautomerase (transcriptional regulator TenI)
VKPIPVVHVVTNDEVLLRDDFLPLARSVMTALGPQGAVHLRSRWLGGQRLYELALWLAGWERETGCWAVVNDRLDVALAAEIEAIQLTSRSVRPADARQLNPAFRVGASVHTPEAATAAQREAADWCIAGTAFPTASHPGRPGGGLSLLREIAAVTRLPVIAIGGVTPAVAPDLAAVGVYGAATINGVWNASDVAEAARGYLSAYGADGRAG